MFSPCLLTYALLSSGLVSAVPLSQREVAPVIDQLRLPPVESFLSVRHDFLAARHSNHTNTTVADPGYGPNHVFDPSIIKHFGPGPVLIERDVEDTGSEGYDGSEAGADHVFDPSIINHFGPGPVVLDSNVEDDDSEGYDDGEAGDGHVFDPSITAISDPALWF